MNKEFEHIRLEHVECLSWWFWTRESFSAINNGIVEVFTDPDPIANNVWEWMLLMASIPYAYAICFNLAAAYRKKYVIGSVKSDQPFIIYNKKNIEYFTLLEKLCGDHYEHG